MAIAFFGTGTAFAASTNAVNVAPPASVPVNAVMFAAFALNSNTPSLTPPAGEGWTHIPTVDGVSGNNELNPGTGISMRLMMKVSDGSEPGTHNFLLATSQQVAARIFVYTGVDTTTPMDVTYTTSSNPTNDLTIEMSAITPVTAGAWVCRFGAQNSTSTTTTGYSTPAGHTERGEVLHRRGFVWADLPWSGSGAVAATSSTVSGGVAGHSGGISIALRPTGTADTTAPTAPTSLTATDATNPVLTWTQGTDAVGVTQNKIYRSTSQSTGYSLLATISAATTYTDSSAKSAGVTYWYRVTALDAATNESPQSVEDSGITPAPDTTRPSDVTGMASTGGGTVTASLSWNAATDNVAVTGYDLYRAPQSGAFVFVKNVAGTSTTDAPGAGTWEYKVKAKDAAGNESLNFSNTTTITTTAPAGPAGTIIWRRTGAVTHDGFRASAKVSGTTSARLVVSTSPTMTSPTYFNAGAPNTGSVIKAQATGLTPNVQYYYQWETNGNATLGLGGEAKTAPVAPGTPTSFRWAASACSDDPTNEAIFTNLRDERPLFYVNQGDHHYNDLQNGTLAQYRALFDNVLTSFSNQQALYSQIPFEYVWDDHDWAGNGSTRLYYRYTGGGGAGALHNAGPSLWQMHREYFPSYDLPNSASEGVYRAWQVGRVHFILLDSRSHADYPVNPATGDPLSPAQELTKTKLGPEQKAWLDAYMDAHKNEPKFVFGGQPWYSTPEDFGDDGWTGYNIERDALINGWAARGVKNVCLVAGDMHASAFDNGTNSPGGLPVIQAAAMDSKISNKGGPYSVGPYPVGSGTTPTAATRLYTIVDITDTGTGTITANVRAKSEDGVVRLNNTITFTGVAAGPTVKASAAAATLATVGAAGAAVETKLSTASATLATTGQATQALLEKTSVAAATPSITAAATQSLLTKTSAAAATLATTAQATQATQAMLSVAAAPLATTAQATQSLLTKTGVATAAPAFVGQATKAQRAVSSAATATLTVSGSAAGAPGPTTKPSTATTALTSTGAAGQSALVKTSAAAGVVVSVGAAASGVVVKTSAAGANLTATAQAGQSRLTKESTAGAQVSTTSAAVSLVVMRSAAGATLQSGGSVGVEHFYGQLTSAVVALEGPGGVLVGVEGPKGSARRLEGILASLAPIAGPTGSVQEVVVTGTVRTSSVPKGGVSKAEGPTGTLTTRDQPKGAVKVWGT